MPRPNGVVHRINAQHAPAYEEFTDQPEAARSHLGPVHDHRQPRRPSLAEPKLEASFDQLASVLELLAEARALGRVGELLARFLSHAIAFGVDAAITILEPFTGLVKRAAEALPAPPGRLHLPRLRLHLPRLR